MSENISQMVSFINSKESGAVSTNESLEDIVPHLEENYDLLDVIDALEIRLSKFREVISKLAIGSNKKKVLIIDRAHFLKPELYNTILKTLEEPRNTFFIFLTDSTLPSTLKSRVVFFNRSFRSSSSIDMKSLDPIDIIKACENSQELVLDFLLSYFIEKRSLFLEEILDIKESYRKGVKIDAQLMIILNRINSIAK